VLINPETNNSEGPNYGFVLKHNLNPLTATMRAVVFVAILAVAAASGVVNIAAGCTAQNAQTITRAVEFRGSSMPFHTEVVAYLANGVKLRELPALSCSTCLRSANDERTPLRLATAADYSLYICQAGRCAGTAGNILVVCNPVDDAWM
jgi:hypothetical protein